jgi:predicted RNA binding protein YcfA (HicA-like mRNA interferase family)
MSRREKVLRKVMDGGSDGNIPFDELCNLLGFLGFNERIRGSHHIFSRNGVMEIVNIQSVGGMSKVYQVKQIRNIIAKYGLGATIND